MLGSIEIIPGLYWIGSEDPDLRVFDDLFPTEHGTSYNAYLLKWHDRLSLSILLKKNMLMNIWIRSDHW